MVKLFIDDNHIGDITEAQLQFLKNALEEDSVKDNDYYVNQDTLTYLKNKGADKELIDLLHNAIGDIAGSEVRWEE